MPPVPAAGVPFKVAVPLLLATKVTPVGSLPISVNVVVPGTPGVVVIVKAGPAVPTLNVALAAFS